MDSPPASWQEVWAQLRSRPLRKAAGAAALLAWGRDGAGHAPPVGEQRDPGGPLRERDRKVMEAVLWRKPK